MAWTVTDDLDAYVRVAAGFLDAEPVRNTIILGVIESLRASGLSRYGAGPPLFGWWWQQDPAGLPVRGAFVHTPPYPILLSPLPGGAAAALAGTLADRGRALPGVTAADPDAEAFAAAWSSLTGAAAVPGSRRRLYRLDSLSDPDPFPPGAARVATAADRELLTTWFTAFSAEVSDEFGSPAREVEERLSYRGLTLWENEGEPVSLAGVTRQAAGVVRIGPVYTPPGRRGCGYAAAATVTVSRAALDSGAADVVLFTDLDNPTSNALYQRLGYRPVEDRVLLMFG